MEQFLSLFFFIDKLPAWVLAAGMRWGIDMACLCALPNFFNLILHFIIGGIIVIMLMQIRFLDLGRDDGIVRDCVAAFLFVIGIHCLFFGL